MAAGRLAPRVPEPPQVRYPLVLLAAACLAFFALVEFLDGWYEVGFGVAPSALARAYALHAEHITPSLVLAAGAVAWRAWAVRSRAGDAPAPRPRP